MWKRSTLILVVILATSVPVSVGDEPAIVAEVDWYFGETPPSSTCTIYPSEPTINDIISFYVPTWYFSNVCEAWKTGLTLPTLHVYSHNVALEFEYVPPCWGCVCTMEWNPVCGFQGRFGPLDEGEHRFFTFNHPEVLCDITFHVSSLKVVEPNGGESLIAGTTHTITWADYRADANRPDAYVLKLSVDNGQSWMHWVPPIEPNCVGELCSYDWIVPAIDSNQCLIRIVDANDPSVSDTSDGVFTMYRCRVKGDVTGDCLVNFADLAVLVQEWLKCGNPFDPTCVE